MNIVMPRFGYLAEATIGWLRAGALKLATLEEPWHPDPDGPGGQALQGSLPASCVPDGTYTLEPHSGGKQHDVWALVNHELGVYHWPSEIPTGKNFGRSAVLIHVGNSVDDIEGCIAIGLRHGVELNRRWVYESAKALDQLRLVLGTHETHQLIIRPTAGTGEAL